MKMKILLPFILLVFFSCNDEEMVLTNKTYIFYVASTSENYNCELTLLGGSTAKTKTQKVGIKKTLLKTTISDKLGLPQGIAYYTQEKLYVGEVYEFRATSLDDKFLKITIYESDIEIGKGFNGTLSFTSFHVE